MDPHAGRKPHHSADPPAGHPAPEASAAFEALERAEAAIRAFLPRVGGEPTVGVVLGSGLGAWADALEGRVAIPYAEIPEMPTPKVVGHSGNLVLGHVGSVRVACLQGRVHAYEGHPFDKVVFGSRLLARIGCRTVLLTNAAGGIRRGMRPGDLMIVTDHLNLMGRNPLAGPNEDRLGPRFPDMCEPYCQHLVDRTLAIARREDITAHKGVFVAVAGPNLETRAEYRFLRMIGADVVGMSTVPETIVAVHCGMKVVGLSVVTDMCLPDSLKPANVADIIAIANAAEPKLRTLVRGIVAEATQVRIA